MPFKKENRSLIIAIIVTVVTAIIFLFLFLFLGINHRKDVYDNSKKLAAEISRKAAHETQSYLSTAIMITRSLEQRLRLIRKYEGSREEINIMLKSAISENPSFLGIWTIWEPDAFDGKDYLYKDDTLYNDQGSLEIGYFRDNKEIYYEIMTYADYIGPHYISAKKLKEEVIIEPYRFRYSGYKHVFFATTISVPIIVDDKFLGAIGIDIDLESLQNKLNKVRPYQSGYLSLISNNGTIVTHIDTSLVNESIFSLFGEREPHYQNAIVSGKELTVETRSEFTNKKVFRLFYPIIVSKKSKPWSMMIEIPLTKAIYLSRKLLFVSIGILFVGLSLLMYLIINIIDRKRYEEEILDAKTLAEESNRLKSAFLNNISHEIRTPLNGVLVFSELIATGNNSESDVKIYRENIQQSSARLLSIISNVIELSKIQAKQRQIAIREFEIEKVIAEVIKTYNDGLEEKKLKITTNFPENINSYTISSDEDKFKQVLSNLLDNAIKFTHRGFIEIGYSVQQDSYLFYVKDTGIGIKPENKKNIFNYFIQEELSLTRKYGGLGIGLSISKSYVDMLEGSIWFESEEENLSAGRQGGSTFYFSLPRLDDKHTGKADDKN